MKLSVVIPTYNGAHKISGLLQALLVQSRKPDEIIVVVDGSTDSTMEVLSGFQALLPQLRIIHQMNSGRSIVRNRGAGEATGDFLLFFDDDMVPQPDCIEVHMRHHTLRSQSILAGAQIDSSIDTDFQRFKTMLSQKWDKAMGNTSDNPQLRASVFLTAANFSIPRSVFFNLGGFDEQLRDAEDFDLAVRAIDRGVPVYYNRSALAFHNDPLTGVSYIRRLRQYRHAHHKLATLYPDRYMEFAFMHPLSFASHKRMLFKLFANRLFVNWLDQGTLKWLLPRHFRYKLYDLIITANSVVFPARVRID